jgi:hypothetical protein
LLLLPRVLLPLGGDEWGRDAAGEADVGGRVGQPDAARDNKGDGGEEEAEGQALRQPVQLLLPLVFDWVCVCVWRSIDRLID